MRPTGLAMPMPITGIGEAWQQADAARHRLLLGAFFEKLYVEEDAVVKYGPRREYSQEIEALIQLVVGDALEYEVPLRGRGTNPNREFRASDLFSGGGKGGSLSV